MLAGALTFAAFQLLVGSGGHSSDSLRAAKLVERARADQLALFTTWRNAWMGLRDLDATGLRFWSLHCHFDDAGILKARHLIRNGRSRKSMCPVWFQGGGTRADEAAGIDSPLGHSSRERVRQLRAGVLRLLDSAAVVAPTDAWVLGQRVRLYADQGDFDRAVAIATSECRASPAACALLAGFALASGGNWKSAAAAFEFARKEMSQEERCANLDISFLIDARTRDRHGKLACSVKDSIANRFWWLADPLFAQPGNERVAVHLYRRMLVSLRSALDVDEHIDWRPAYGGLAASEMYVRYGLPSVAFYHPMEHMSHNSWLGWPYKPVNSSHEYYMPRYHTTPPYDVAASRRPMGPADVADVAPRWDEKHRTFDDEWWPLEHFARTAPLLAMDMQTAAFRRRGGPLLAVATDPRSRLISDAALRDYTALLFVSQGPGDTVLKASRPAAMTAAGTLPLSIQARPGAHIVSAEVVALERDSAAAARARWAVTLPEGLDALPAGQLAMSDAALFAAPQSDDALPRSLPGLMERMLPTTTLRVPRVGVFVEMYGIAQGDPVELTLTVIADERAGLLRRIGNRLGITDPDGQAFVVRWRDDQPGTASSAESVGGVVVQTRSIVLNLGALSPGKYRLVVGASRPGEAVVITSREFAVAR
jgi:hypothetical protein